MLRPILKAVRPHQWVKNLFVAAPLVFAKRLGDVSSDLRAAAAFGAFCLLSSAVYLVNDLVDIEKDRAHPIKRNRPIASGALKPELARVLAGTVRGRRAGRRPAARLELRAHRGRLPRAQRRLLAAPQADRVRRRRLHQPRASCCACWPARSRSTSRRRAGCWSARCCCRRCSASASARTSCASAARTATSSARCWAPTTRACCACCSSCWASSRPSPI